MVSVLADVRVHEWLRGLGAAVAEGTGRGSVEWEGKGKMGGRTYRYGTSCGEGCASQRKTCSDIYICGCNCCLEKRTRAEVAASVSLPSTGAESSAPSGVVPLPGVTNALHGEQPSTGDPNAKASTPFRPDPQAIAAVIVAIIVAIILLDLCIFRFPVGRNIRDFLVRKMPFCIAFYS
ncbi:hypothetical protein BBBOND_0310270 [Babesia bigemina]|uniref:Uncharacterized protein n=1 Tax=Babesia bigemina TaxID=5866 RepID=A0A061DD58_BABBI|nr:hypothetical protein BBBOND_0310270 [Babesia bigemina]CDR97124.1 hypothetical protein BBBOND_0310270 [Babesia bigemina]|eukprot:XP_012769310.1 hypothetical protein BBBOND_0310270 [Babesia bigemina]